MNIANLVQIYVHMQLSSGALDLSLTLTCHHFITTLSPFRGYKKLNYENSNNTKQFQGSFSYIHSLIIEVGGTWSYVKHYLND